jgi:hypothetical protein
MIRYSHVPVSLKLLLRNKYYGEGAKAPSSKYYEGEAEAQGGMTTRF